MLNKLTTDALASILKNQKYDINLCNEVKAELKNRQGAAAAPSLELITSNTVQSIMKQLDVNYDSAEKIYAAYKKSIDDLDSLHHNRIQGRLTASQYEALSSDIKNNYSTIVDRTVKFNRQGKQVIDIIQAELNIPFADLIELYLTNNHIELSTIEKNDKDILELITETVVKYRQALIALSQNPNPDKGLETFNASASRTHADFLLKFGQLKSEKQLKQRQSKQFLLDLINEDNPIQDSNDTSDLSKIKSYLDKCYDKLQDVIEVMDDVYESLDTRQPSNTLKDIIESLMDMPHHDYHENIELINYLKVYKTIKLSVGRFRGITDTICNMVTAKDIIVVPEYHKKQHYSHLPSVVITADELALIPKECEIGNVYIDYYKTLFDKEIVDIYNNLGRNHKQFFIMLG